MKKFLIFFIIFGFTTITSVAQDIITKKDGTDIEAKILEVSSNNVRYQKYSNLDGPTYNLATDEILMIRYSNGEKEIFQSSNKVEDASVQQYKKALPYSQLKKQYDYKEYTPAIGDKYSVGWCGVASAIIPGLGQAICNEWGYACGFFFSNAILGGLGSYYAKKSYIDLYPTWKYDVYGAVLCYAAAVGVDIVAIVNAVRVAKVKNMYLRDSYSSVDIRISPSFAFTPVDNNYSLPSYGLSMKVTF